MNKAQLAHLIADRVGLTKTQGEAVVATFVDVVIDTLKADDKVSIAGFGEFSARTRAGRIGVNPRNPSEKITIPPVRVAKFKAGTVLKKALKGEDDSPAASDDSPTDDDQNDQQTVQEESQEQHSEPQSENQSF